MPFLTQGKTNWKLLLIVVILAAVVGGGIWFLQQQIPSYQIVEIEIPEKKSNEECQKYTEAECPEGCIVCPPCEACSSLGCNSAEYCKSMGFDESWYETIKLQRETADWQTYRNEEYGFEIKYPDNFFNKIPEIILDECNNQCLFINAIGTAPQGGQTLNKITVDNIPACLEKDIDSGVGNVEENDYLGISAEGKCFAIHFFRTYPSCSGYYGLPEYQTEYDNCINNNNNQNTIFDQVISTFKFID